MLPFGIARLQGILPIILPGRPLVDRALPARLVLVELVCSGIVWPFGLSMPVQILTCPLVLSVPLLSVTKSRSTNGVQVSAALS